MWSGEILLIHQFTFALWYSHVQSRLVLYRHLKHLSGKSLPVEKEIIPLYHTENLFVQPVERSVSAFPLSFIQTGPGRWLHPAYPLSREKAQALCLPSTTPLRTSTPFRGSTEERARKYTLRAPGPGQRERTGRPMEPESEFIIKIQDINDNEPKFLGRALRCHCAGNVTSG